MWRWIFEKVRPPSVSMFVRNYRLKINTSCLSPEVFAHGFVVLSETAIFSYKVDNYYSPECDRGIKFDDPLLGIDWKIAASELVLSDNDKTQPLLQDAVDLFDYSNNLYD